MMKIAVLVHSLDGIGGVAKHALHLSREFAAMGHQVTVWAVEHNRDRCYPELAEGLDIRALREAYDLQSSRRAQQAVGVRLWLYVQRLWASYQVQRRLALAMSAGYDVVNAHGYGVSWAAVTYKRLHGTPVVWLSNDFVPVHARNPALPLTAARRLKDHAKGVLLYPFVRYDRGVVRDVDRILVLSERVQAQIAAHYGVEPVIVRAGVDTISLAYGDGQPIRRRYGIGDDTFLLLTVSMPMPRRRLEDVVRAMRILVDGGLDITYLIVGRTSYDPAYTQRVRDEVSACGLDERVIFTGEVSEAELVQSFHACDAFVWPSDENQSWGMAGMEAMAAGKPVIVSKANGLAEVLQDGRTALLVNPRAPEEIAEAVRRIATQPDLVDALARQGQHFVRDGYSWHTNARTLTDLFAQVVRSNPASSALSSRHSRA